MKKKLVVQSSIFILLIGIADETSAFENLLSKIPPAANAVVIIDVQRTLTAPLAEKEGWGKELELAYVSRPVFLPPEATKLVMAANLQAGGDFRRQWELAVMQLSEPMGMRSIARSEGGYVETLRNRDIAWTPSNAYFIKLNDRELGVVYPADRQFTSRWIGFAEKNTRPMLSDYLSEATKNTSDKVQILQAIDLTDVVQPHTLDERIQNSELFKKAKLDSKTAVPMLTSIRGAVLRIIVGDDAQGQLRIDFGQDVSSLKPIAKDLILNVLDDLGSTVPDFDSWKVKIQGKSILMNGPFSQDGLRRVFSVVELPSGKFSMLKEGDEPMEQGTPESLVREASQTYFSSINVLLKDLKRELRGNKATSAIMERYAGRIDRMPILNVDDDLLDYGAGVSQTLRAMALSRRQGGIQAGSRTAGMGGGGYSNYSYNYGYFDVTGDRYAGARASAADRASIKAQAMAESKNARVEGSKQIAEATAEIRRQMTKKYGVEF